MTEPAITLIDRDDRLEIIFIHDTETKMSKLHERFCQLAFAHSGPGRSAITFGAHKRTFVVFRDNIAKAEFPFPYRALQKVVVEMVVMGGSVCKTHILVPLTAPGWAGFEEDMLL